MKSTKVWLLILITPNSNIHIIPPISKIHLKKINFYSVIADFDDKFAEKIEQIISSV